MVCPNPLSWEWVRQREREVAARSNRDGGASLERPKRRSILRRLLGSSRRRRRVERTVVELNSNVNERQTDARDQRHTASHRSGRGTRAG